MIIKGNIDNLPDGESAFMRRANPHQRYRLLTNRLPPITRQLDAVYQVVLVIQRVKIAALLSKPRDRRVFEIRQRDRLPPLHVVDGVNQRLRLFSHRRHRGVIAPHDIASLRDLKRRVPSRCDAAPIARIQ